MKKVELAVIGAGPAGLDGAIESAKMGVNVAPFSWITPISAQPLYLVLALLTLPRKQIH